MAQIKIEMSMPPVDGMDIKFKAPCDCTQITGLLVEYPGGSKTFTFRDCHGNNLAGIGNLFGAGAYINVIVDVGKGYAYLQNADNNGFLNSAVFGTYTHAGGNLIGHGENGKFKATTSGTISTINVNGVSCSVRCAGESSIELIADNWYTFILDGNTVNFNAGGGGAGGVLTVTAPAGVTVTVSKSGKQKTKTADANGRAVFKGLETGSWTLTITDGTKTSYKTVNITADYSTVIAFFAATIYVTYPAGSVCTCSDGTTTLTAPDTSGTWNCIVPNAGTWTVSCTNGTKTDVESVSITTDGQSQSVTLMYILWLYKSGDTCNAVTGGWRTTNQCSLNTANTNPTPTNMKVDTNSGQAGSAATKNKIDLSGFNTLVLKGYASSHRDNNLLYVGNADSSNFNYITNNVAKTNIATGNTNSIVRLDISSVSGSYHVGCGASDSAAVFCFEMYLE